MSQSNAITNGQGTTVKKTSRLFSRNIPVSDYCLDSGSLWCTWEVLDVFQVVRWWVHDLRYWDSTRKCIRKTSFQDITHLKNSRDLHCSISFKGHEVVVVEKLFTYKHIQVKFASSQSIPRPPSLPGVAPESGWLAKDPGLLLIKSLHLLKIHEIGNSWVLFLQRFNLWGWQFQMWQDVWCANA